MSDVEGDDTAPAAAPVAAAAASGPMDINAAIQVRVHVTYSPCSSLSGGGLIFEHEIRLWFLVPLK